VDAGRAPQLRVDAFFELAFRTRKLEVPQSPTSVKAFEALAFRERGRAIEKVGLVFSEVSHVA
jgi:hypothetical protein